MAFFMEMPRCLDGRRGVMDLRPWGSERNTGTNKFSWFGAECVGRGWAGSVVPSFAKPAERQQPQLVLLPSKGGPAPHALLSLSHLYIFSIDGRVCWIRGSRPDNCFLACHLHALVTLVERGPLSALGAFGVGPQPKSVRGAVQKARNCVRTFRCYCSGSEHMDLLVPVANQALAEV